jgi:hypothetical protein
MLIKDDTSNAWSNGSIIAPRLTSAQFGRFAPRGGSPQDILNVRLSGSDRQSDCSGEEKNLLSLQEFESKFCDRQAHSPVLYIEYYKYYLLQSVCLIVLMIMHRAV